MFMARGFLFGFVLKIDALLPFSRNQDKRAIILTGCHMDIG